MFTPIKKIFTYIQKNASGSNMFSPQTNTAGQREAGASDLTAHEEGAERDRIRDREDESGLDRDEKRQLLMQQQLVADDEFDIERQIKTSIIDATKVHAAKAKAMATLPLPLEQLDDELADFAHGPADPELEEQFLELDNFPNNEIIVLSDADLNSSIASDAVSEDPLAIDNILDSSSVTTNEEADTSGELLWLKLDSEKEIAPSAAEATSSGQPPQEPAKQVKTKEDELRDGGSDSGLGSETTALVKGKPDKEPEPEPSDPQETKPTRSNLKRRLEDNESDVIDLPDMSAQPVASQKRAKRSINFDQVKVYYFPRQQGFSCVPTAGGCTLGMGARHVAFKTMTLAEHAAELRRAHRNQNQDLQARGSSSDDSEESEEDYLSEGSGSDADDGSNGFLQPVTPKQRRALLKAAGVRKIDASEKSECRDIRNSREVCGCSCREFCDPETCACSQAGIKCQVDRAMFPCGCTREACGNTVGRVEFNPTRVRTHYIHTVMRLDLEQRQGSVQGIQGGHLQQQQQQQQQSHQAISSYSPVGTGNAASTYFLQTQSNYSSGYASPAYTPESSVSYYQQQVQQQQSPGNTTSASQQTQTQGYATYGQLDSLDSGLFASGSNATPSYGELYQSLSYGGAQITSYSATYQSHSSSSAVVAAAAGTVSSCAYSSCAVPSAPPYGNATTTASSNAPYQTTAASMTAASTPAQSRLIGNPTGTAASTSPATGTASSSSSDFISLSTPIASSSRLSQINDLLQHNRNTTAALVAVSEEYSGGGAVRSTAGATTVDSIDTPPIVEDGQRGCMSFEGLPPPLVTPAPIVAVVESKLPPMTTLPLPAAASVPPSAPQPRQPLDQHHQSIGESS
ncbi:hypothetical protein KR026_004499 [Drosophila bipectinata]|nr:hypothetical protein KR026_004499 [Drosophila bipectinata]